MNHETYPQMKNLKKFAALLLAGAMALLMLTACGGGGEVGERVPEAESNLFDRYANSSQASNIKENNKSLQAIADGHLQKDLNTDISIFGGPRLVADVHLDGVEDRYLIVTVTANYTGGPLSEAALAFAETLIGKKLPGTNVDVHGKGTWVDMGVVVRELGTRKYVAVAIKIENPNYK